MSQKIFMSYKSEDAVAIRMIAEQMRAQGLNVWFAEYNVGVRERIDFQRMIDTAIADCDYGVCFTNDLYASSEFCRSELRQLLCRLPSENILEIAFPRGDQTHHLFPQLSGIHFLEVPVSRVYRHSITLSLDDTNLILDFISRATGIQIAHCNYQESGYSKRLRFRSRGIRYSIDVAGWSMKEPGLLTRLRTWRSLGPMYERQSPDGNAMWGHLLSGKQDVSIKRIGIGTANDREYYEAALKSAHSYYENVQRQHCAGVHLLFAEGFSHPAFTTIKRGPGLSLLMGQQTWMRLYSVVMGGRWRWSRDIEFAFFFFVRGSLESFLRCAHILDRLVLSFRREP